MISDCLCFGRFSRFEERLRRKVFVVFVHLRDEFPPHEGRRVYDFVSPGEEMASHFHILFVLSLLTAPSSVLAPSSMARSP